MRLSDQLVELRQHLRAHAQILQVEPAGFLVEQAQHRAFAVAGGQGGDPHIDGLAADAQRDAAVLRQAFLGDVELCHDLDARDQRGMDRLLRLHHVAQTAVDAKAHHRVLFERFDMDIRCSFAQCLGQQRIDHADHRRIIGRFEQVFDRRHVQHQLVQVEIGFVFIDHLRRVAAGSGIGFCDRRFEFGSRHSFQPDPSETAADFGDCAGCRRIRYPDLDRIIGGAVALRQQRVVAGV